MLKKTHNLGAERALGDGPNMLPFKDMPALLRQLKAIREAVTSA